MKAMALKGQAVKAVRGLPENRLRVVLDFIEYLKDREAWKATRDILADEDLVTSIRRGEADIKAGRVKRWDEIKQRV